jgi:hypothetical protein
MPGPKGWKRRTRGRVQSAVLGLDSVITAIGTLCDKATWMQPVCDKSSILISFSESVIH